ncbi:MAG TPA: DUF2256 domain-containing protein [Crenalkalicoccus sp.]|nr:DUF2256 domain-containing protein [Crenalkalicoccus sp.]
MATACCWWTRGAAAWRARSGPAGDGLARTAHRKPAPPAKTRAACGRPLAWRRKWARGWCDAVPLPPRGAAPGGGGGRRACPGGALDPWPRGL